MILCAMLHAALSFVQGKTYSDWFNGIEILQGRWQHGEKEGYCYPSGLEKTLCKWDVYVPLLTKGLRNISARKSTVYATVRSNNRKILSENWKLVHGDTSECVRPLDEYEYTYLSICLPVPVDARSKA